MRAQFSFLSFLTITCAAQSSLDSDIFGIGHDEFGAERPVIVRRRLFDMRAIFTETPTETPSSEPITPSVQSDDMPSQNPRQSPMFVQDNRFPNRQLSDHRPANNFPSNNFPPNNLLVSNVPPRQQHMNFPPPQNMAPSIPLPPPQNPPTNFQFPPPPPQQVQTQPLPQIMQSTGQFPVQQAPTIPQPMQQQFPDPQRPSMPVALSQQRFVDAPEPSGQFLNQQQMFPNKQLGIDTGPQSMGNAASQPGIPTMQDPAGSNQNFPVPPNQDPMAGAGVLGVGPIPEGMMNGVQLPPVPQPIPPPMPAQQQPPMPPSQQQPMPVIVPGQRIPVVNGVPVLPGRQNDNLPSPPPPDVPPGNDNQNMVAINQPDMGGMMDRVQEMTSGLANTQQELMERINQQSGVIAFLMKSLVKENPKSSEVASNIPPPPNNKPSSVSTGFMR